MAIAGMPLLFLLLFNPKLDLKLTLHYATVIAATTTTVETTPKTAATTTSEYSD